MHLQGERGSRTAANSVNTSVRTHPNRFASVASSDSIDGMATLTIRQLDEKTKARLRVRAAHHGHSMEAEAREILRSALTASSPVKGNLAETIHRRFAAFGGLELDLPRRDAMRQAPEFAE
jgi:antitoxin FitA